MGDDVMGLSNDEVAKYCHDSHPSTQDFIMQQTMYRIKDPRRSLKFYTKVLGMTLLKKMDFPGMKFSLYFMGFEKKEDIPKDEKQRCEWAMSRKATIELTHNWGTENQKDFAYKIGNQDNIGYGHIGLMVPDVYAACQRFEELGVQFVKKPDDGKMKGLAFIRDPDGYWIEIFSAKSVAENCGA